MRLRSFFKSLLATPAMLVPASEVKPVDPFKFLEMQTTYGTPVLAVILPDGSRRTFCHCPRTGGYWEGSSEQQFWECYRGDWRDFELHAYRDERKPFPFYKAIEHSIRWAYANNPKSPLLT